MQVRSGGRVGAKRRGPARVHLYRLDAAPPRWCPLDPREREFVIDNLLVRVHFIIVMIRWTGLAPWEFAFPFPGSLTSTFLVPRNNLYRTAGDLPVPLDTEPGK